MEKLIYVFTYLGCNGYDVYMKLLVMQNFQFITISSHTNADSLINVDARPESCVYA